MLAGIILFYSQFLIINSKVLLYYEMSDCSINMTSIPNRITGSLPLTATGPYQCNLDYITMKDT